MIVNVTEVNSLGTMPEILQWLADLHNLKPIFWQATIAWSSVNPDTGDDIYVAHAKFHPTIHSGQQVDLT